jgi:hypothetical protein
MTHLSDERINQILEAGYLLGGSPPHKAAVNDRIALARYAVVKEKINE